GSFTVTAVGVPAPTLSMTGGTLPLGITFDPVTGILSGTAPASAVGVYALQFTASNGILPNAVQNFTLTILDVPPKRQSGPTASPTCSRLRREAIPTISIRHP